MGTLFGLDKLLEIAARGLGAVVGPLLAPWRAQREGRARIIAAEADAKVLEIQAKAYVKVREFAAPCGAMPGVEAKKKTSRSHPCRPVPRGDCRSTGIP